MTISWTPPESDGGAEITSYILEKKKQSTFSSWKKTEVKGESMRVTELKRGGSFVYKVCAKNNVGVGEYSQESETHKTIGTFDTYMLSVML